MSELPNFGAIVITISVAGFWVYCAYGWWKIRKNRIESENE